MRAWDRVGNDLWFSTVANQIGALEAGTYDFFNSKFKTFFNYSLNNEIKLHFYGKYTKRFFRQLDDEDAVFKVRYFPQIVVPKSKLYKLLLN